MSRMSPPPGEILRGFIPEDMTRLRDLRTGSPCGRRRGHRSSSRSWFKSWDHPAVSVLLAFGNPRHAFGRDAFGFQGDAIDFKGRFSGDVLEVVVKLPQ